MKSPKVPSQNIHASHRTDNGVLALYVFGFIWSILLTLTAYFWVVNRLFSGHTLLYAICGLAVVQCAVQLYFFLHVTAGTKPRWKLISFGFMLLIVGIVVIGSLWIMHSLNYRMMSPSDIDKYMQSQQGI